MGAAIRLYLDEPIPLAIASQLRRREIEVFTLQELGVLGDSDANHLERATKMGCVLCTCDGDFLKLAADGMEHARIVFGNQLRHSIGDWVNALVLIHAVYTPDDMKNHVEYL